MNNNKSEFTLISAIHKVQNPTHNPLFAMNEMMRFHVFKITSNVHYNNSNCRELQIASITSDWTKKNSNAYHQRGVNPTFRTLNAK